MIKLRAKTPNRGDLTLELPLSSTIGDLRQRIQDATSIDVMCQQLLFAYPIKEITSLSSILLTAVPLRSGDSVLVRVSEPVLERASSSSVASLPSPSTESKVSAVVAADTASSSSSSSSISSSVVTSFPLSSERKQLISSSSSMIVHRRIIDHDNSCLFNAVGYALDNRNRQAADNLRTIVAGVIASAPDIYTAGYLGKPLEEYIEWIMNPEKWGGAIEMAILSDYYEAEIAAVDIETTNVYIYGLDKNYTKRAYLLYNGIHFDTLVCNPMVDGKEETLDMTIFEPSDNALKARFVGLAKQLQQSKKYTNVQSFSLRCVDCGTPFVGAVEATEHAKATRHVNFTEYK